MFSTQASPLALGLTTVLLLDRQDAAGHRWDGVNFTGPLHLPCFMPALSICRTWLIDFSLASTDIADVP